MKPMGFLPVAVLFLGSMAASEEANSFRDQQLQYPRVRAAAKEKDHVLRRRCEEKKISYPPRAILFRAFKREARLELWACTIPEILTFSSTPTRFVLLLECLGRSENSATCRCPRDSTNSIGSIHRAIFF